MFRHIVMKGKYSCILLLIIFSFSGIGNIGYAQPGNVIVPNVQGIEQKVAAQIIRTSGLQPRTQGSLDVKALVTVQNPQPGVNLTPGSEVILITGPLQQGAESSRALQPVFPVPSGSSEVASITTSGGSILTAGSSVSVQPLSPVSQQQSRVISVQNLQDASYTLASLPQKAPTSYYLLADNRIKKYPPWYPKAFLEQAVSQSVQGQAQVQTLNTGVQVQAVPQATGTSSILSNVTPHWHEGWYYPLAWTPQGKAAISSTMGQSTSLSTQNVQEGTVTIQAQQQISGSVPVPNLLRLYEADAVFALQKAGLVVGTVTRIQHPEWRPGLIMEQSPRTRAIVEAGTEVHLWVTE